MSHRARIRKLQKIVFAKDPRGEMETIRWDPLDIESTKVLLKQTEVPHTQRKVRIRILGEPPQKVFHALAASILPVKEVLQTLSDADLDSYMQRYLSACHDATNVSRCKQGLPPVQWDWSIRSVGSEFNNIMTEASG